MTQQEQTGGQDPNQPGQQSAGQAPRPDQQQGGQGQQQGGQPSVDPDSERRSFQQEEQQPGQTQGEGLEGVEREDETVDEDRESDAGEAGVR